MMMPKNINVLLRNDRSMRIFVNAQVCFTYSFLAISFAQPAARQLYKDVFQ